VAKGVSSSAAAERPFESKKWIAVPGIRSYNFPCRAGALVAANNRRVKYLDGTERKKASNGASEQGRQNLNDGQAKASETT